VDARTLARFPFLKEARDHITANGISLGDLLTNRAWASARDRGKERVRETLEDVERVPLPEVPTASDQDQWREILSYPVARMIVSCVADNYLVRRYALAEAIRAGSRLAQEDARFVNLVAGQLDLDFRLDGDTASVHFLDYLHTTASLRGKEWKLINQPVSEGRVELRREKAVRLLRNAVQAKIEKELPLEVAAEVEAAFADEVRDLRKALVERKARFRREDLGKGDINHFPPCMQKILADIQAHENVPHMGRFAIVAFLHTLGFSNEEIFKLFGDVPDFAVDVTKYQIEHITGTTSPTEYTPPECSTMKSYGVCPGGDALCHQEWMTHPLKYYRYKARRRRPTSAPQAPSPASPSG